MEKDRDKDAAGQTAPAPGRGDYGVDAPTVVRNLLIGGLALMVMAAGIHYGPPQSSGLMRRLYGMGLFAGPSWVVTALFMLYASRVRKLRLRDRWLDELVAEKALGGEQRVLDVGCGRGLLLIGAARRLPRGRAVGLDIWQTVDQSGNDPETTKQNAAAEGVEGRIELHTGDARNMPFADGEFDVIVSSWALHNIPDSAGREKAVREIARVLKPGGRLLIVDIGPTRAYARVLRACGYTDVRRRLASFLFVIPSFRIDARRPA